MTITVSIYHHCQYLPSLSVSTITVSIYHRCQYLPSLPVSTIAVSIYHHCQYLSSLSVSTITVSIYHPGFGSEKMLGDSAFSGWKLANRFHLFHVGSRRSLSVNQGFSSVTDCVGTIQAYNKKYIIFIIYTSNI